MTARPYGMARPCRSWPGGLVAVVMIVVLVAAAALFSAASAHHAGDHVYAGHTAVAPVVAHHDETAHEHQHGNEWTPHPVKRLRVAADVVAVAVLPVVAPPLDRDVVRAGTVVASDPDLSLLGVLRI
ncbi:hypothetical protein [Actinoplanes flavus]|uniref:Uncharacterized protein n=1 Tax=Actinoplanes flavus TaxID=2820290 RepID=A0ABS3UHL3_9ACTN|nr:hypothetical protein [Actinoplanes flavus]MBO3737686.1 hypothetical protein [Actinoplanes flavus]